jgi:hypothetical protein
MNESTISGFDRALAKICLVCPACRRARATQAGLAFQLVQTVETKVCPFCRAFERVFGRKAHQRLADPAPR